jgi:hypothetical protein
MLLMIGVLVFLDQKFFARFPLRQISLWLIPLYTSLVFTFRNIISPEISLNTAKILYHWNIRLESGTIRTKVDPTEAIHVSWTDRTKYGRWVTDFSFPLKGTTLSLLAAQIRIRRQFTF